jgi:predicted  nucleic acid-binding Zn ribbon protein
MYIQKISIHIPTDKNKDELTDEFSLLMSFYRSSGQTQGKIEPVYVQDDKIICTPFTIEENALDQKNNNFYVDTQTKKIEALCNSSLQFETLGKTHESYDGACACDTSDFYILTIHSLTIESPLTCGNCNRTVPLYKTPAYDDHGYMPILNWETNYISCDNLQMNCQVGESWALDQMQELNSELSTQGRNICKKIEELTQIPTYYFLYDYKEYTKDQSSLPCPSCSEAWAMKEQLHDLYDFKCDACRVMSMISLNSG